MGKRKKAARKPAQSRRKEPLATNFACIFCHHEGSVSVRVDRKEGVANLVCRICDQRYQAKVNHLTEPIDVYSEWIDAAEAAQQDDYPVQRAAPVLATTSRQPAVQRTELSDDD